MDNQGGAAGAGAVAQAHDQAEAIMTQAASEPEILTQSPGTPGNPPSPTASPSTPPETQAPEAAPAQAPDPDYETFDYRGQEYRLHKSDVARLRTWALDRIEEARMRQEQGGYQAPEQAPAQPAGNEPTDPIAKLSKAIEGLQSRQEKWESDQKKSADDARNRRLAEEVQRANQSAAEALPQWKEFEKLPNAQKLMLTMIGMEQYADPNISPRSAAKKVTETIEAMWSQRQGNYIKGKVQAGKFVSEGKGGGVSTPSQPLTRKSLIDGTAENLALQIALQSQAEP